MFQQLNAMNQLKELKSVQAQMGQRDQQRLGAAKTQYTQAQELLKAYNRSLDKQTLRQCMLLLTECIRASRSYPEPYILLSYIYQALGMTQLALKYLRVAEHLQPGHATVAKIRQAILEGFQAPIVKRSKPGGSAFQLLDLEELDYDALYDEVDESIAREVRVAMDIQIPVRPQASKELIAELEAHQQSLLQTLELLNSQLEVIEQEIDCNPLRSRLRLIESRWRQIVSMQELCRDFLGMKGTLLSLLTDVQMELFEAQPAEQKLESFLDQCDAIADKLDHFSEKGFQLAELQQDYDLLTEAITQLQDRLDA